MERIILAKAQVHGGEAASDFQIDISGPLPEFGTPDFEAEATRFYADQADGLFDAMRQCLPGGTIDQLLIVLLKNRANLWRPSLAQLDGPPRLRNFAICESPDHEWFVFDETENVRSVAAEWE